MQALFGNRIKKGNYGVWTEKWSFVEIKGYQEKNYGLLNR